MDINSLIINIGSGLFVAILGGLILYYFFGIGKSDKKDKFDENSEKHNQILIGTDVHGDFIGRDKVIHYHPSKLHKVKQGGKFHKIKPEAIYNEIRNATPYSRNAIKEKYSGLRVSWQVQLTSFHPYENGFAGIQLRVVSSIFPIVHTVVKLELYPELKLIDQKDTFMIQGELAEITEAYIDIKNPKLIF